jgi:small-conductance mechanosensitive channel
MMIVIFEPIKFFANFANNLIHTAIIIAIGWMAIQIVDTIEAVIYQQFISNDHKKIHEMNALYTKTRIIKNIATVVIALLTLAAILMSFSSVRNIGVSILASAGFLTAIIGLAMQKTLSSLFSGIQIAISQPIRIGKSHGYHRRNFFYLCCH